MINRQPSKQNKTLRVLIGREPNAAQSSNIIPKHAPTNIVTPPPGQWQIRKIAPNKKSAASAHKRRLITFDIILKI